MKIAVLIKQVPSQQTLYTDPETGVLIRSNTNSQTNPYDFAALETGLRIRDAQGGTLTALSMGPISASSVISEAYSVGADDGYLLCDPAFSGADVYATSYALSQAIALLGGFDLLVCGQQTTDGGTAQVGGALAAHLGIPFLYWVTGIQAVYRDALCLEQELSEQVYLAKLQLPALISVKQNLFALRRPTLKQKITARKKQVPMIKCSDLPDADPSHYGLRGSKTHVQKVFAPPVKNACYFLNESSAELPRAFFQLLAEKRLVCIPPQRPNKTNP